VDFSRALIFMTSNLGASEMGSILRPNLGFAASEIEAQHRSGKLDDATTEKVSKAGIEAARRKFTPEFMNRIDKVVVFKPLGRDELRKILGLELGILQTRIFNSTLTIPFVFSVTEEAKDFLLREGTDMKYGARHLKRAIDRALVHPMSNLIATQQVRGGDLIKVDFDADDNQLIFAKVAEDMPAYAMAQMMEASANVPAGVLTAGAAAELPRVAARGRRTPAA
jgi:ATP-dependent Clp protease ATP-binding subunit ClpB